MLKTEIQNLLVVGIDTVAVAKSAREAGYRIYAADYFGDMDLRRICSESRTIVKQKRGKTCGKARAKFKPEAFLKITKSLLQAHQIDVMLLSSGLDDSFDVLHQLNNLVPILGNPPDIIRRVRKKQGFFEELELLDIPHPKTAIVNSIEEAKAAASEIGYPVVIKPAKGFGGVGIRAAWKPEEVQKAYWKSLPFCEKALVQEFISGTQASVSFLVAGKDVTVLTINEQMLGLRSLFQREPFGYCGNIVPLHCSDSVSEKCKLIAEEIALHFDLKGSNGIDLVISEEGTPYVVEVNPRFQGCLECVERVLKINLVESHIDACLHGFLPTVKEKTSAFCTRLILHAPRRIVPPDLAAFPEVRDVPLPGTIVEKGEPLCSIIIEAKNRKLSLQKAKKVARSIYSMLQPV